MNNKQSNLEEKQEKLEELEEFKKLKEFITFPKENQSNQKIFEILKNENKIIQSDNYKSICFIGSTGSEKSLTANNLIEKTFFEVQDSVDYCSQNTLGIFKQLKSSKNKKKYYFIINTPDISFQSIINQKCIDQMVYRLKLLKYVHSFIIVINSQGYKFDQQLKDTIVLFKEMFGESYYKNILFCFTRFSQSKKSNAMREQGIERIQESYILDIHEKFYENFEYRLQDNQFIFIDNTATDPKLCETKELQEFQLSLQKIIQFTDSAEAIFCKDIQEAQKDNKLIFKKIQNYNQKDIQEKIKKEPMEEKQIKIQKQKNEEEQKELDQEKPEIQQRKYEEDVKKRDEIYKARVKQNSEDQFKSDTSSWGQVFARKPKKICFT